MSALHLASNIECGLTTVQFWIGLRI